MAKSDLVALAALALNSGNLKITRLETGLRAYDPNEFYKDRKPVSLKQKEENELQASLDRDYAEFERLQQERWMRARGELRDFDPKEWEGI